MAIIAGAIPLYNGAMTSIRASTVHNTVIAAASNVRRTFANERTFARAEPEINNIIYESAPISAQDLPGERCTPPPSASACNAIANINDRNSCLAFRRDNPCDNPRPAAAGVTFPWWDGTATLRASNRPADYGRRRFTFIMENVPAAVCETVGAAFIGDPQVRRMATAGNNVPQLNNANQRVDLDTGVNLAERCAADDTVNMKIQFRG